MDAEEEITGEIHGRSQSSSIITQPFIEWYLTNIGIFLTEDTTSLARSFYAKHTQSRPKNPRTSTQDDQNNVTNKSFSGSVPLDLAWEILSRLPAKSIVRSRCVSKVWSSITTNPIFINSFPSASSTPPCVLLILQKGETLSVYSFPQHQNPIDLCSQVERYEVVNPNDPHFASCSGSVHGLICLESSKQLVILNPTMRHFFTLPELENSSLSYVRVFLGYDPVECKYKVLSFLKDGGIRLLTLGAQESWRILDTSPTHEPTTSTKGYAQSINGVLYYKATCGWTLETFIMGFDLRSETFHLVESPMDDLSSVLMVTYEGRLGLVRSVATTGVEIWILEDAKRQKWSYKHFLFPPSDKKWKYLDLKGVTDGGELVYTARRLYESFNVTYFDLKRNSIRKTKFQNIACGLFRHLKGFGFGPLKDFHVFPNHIESLLSL